MHALARRLLRHAEILTALGLVFVAGWAFVIWMTLDMSHPAVRLAMPFDAAWSPATAAAVFVMWGGMMVAMMLPSAAPMILTFDALERRNAPAGRATPRSLAFARRLSAGVDRISPRSPPARSGLCRPAAC